MEEPERMVASTRGGGAPWVEDEGSKEGEREERAAEDDGRASKEGGCKVEGERRGASNQISRQQRSTRSLTDCSSSEAREKMQERACAVKGKEGGWGVEREEEEEEGEREGAVECRQRSRRMRMTRVRTLRPVSRTLSAMT